MAWAAHPVICIYIKLIEFIQIWPKRDLHTTSSIHLCHKKKGNSDRTTQHVKNSMALVAKTRS